MTANAGMKTLYLVLLLATCACQERKQRVTDTPNAVRDLLIDRAFWQAEKANHAQDRITGAHRFVITNTSQRYGYQHIKIRFDYYDRSYRRIDSAVGFVEQAVGPRTAIKIDKLETRLTKPSAITATATVVNAAVD